jgi:PadR family transcriptional regulator PadR
MLPGGRWRRGNRMGVCSRRIVRFVEPSLLLLLREDASHGYSLMDSLEQAGFAEGNLDPSIVYRALRGMEQAGLVISQWDTSQPGPPRRVYQLTQSGEDYLSHWIEDLRRMRDELDTFITTYERS